MTTNRIKVVIDKLSNSTRCKMLKGVALLAFAFSLSSASAQTLFVNQLNGSQTDCELSALRKITFSAGQLELTRTDNSTMTFSLDALRNLSFQDYYTDVDELTGETNPLQVYPNPVSERLCVELPAEGTLSILSLDGKVLQTVHVVEAGLVSLSLGDLPQGIYLCQFIENKISKTVRFIKQ